MDLHGIQPIQLFLKKGKKMYRRIVKKEDSKLQKYETVLRFVFLTVMCLFLVVTLILVLKKAGYDFNILLKVLAFILVVLFFLLVCFVFCLRDRDVISTFDLDSMSKKAFKTSCKVRKLFSDKTIIDVLKLSNSTRYGEEMPMVYVWLSDDLVSGYVAIENIANFEKMDKSKYEQKLSGVFSGKYKKYAIVSSELIQSDSYMLFYFEDTMKSYKFEILDNSIQECVSDNKHLLKLSKDLFWDTRIIPHLSIIARTRAGKSFFAGRYLANVMIAQGWKVEYNSSKLDRYVREFKGESDISEIVMRAEYWVSVMMDRLAEIEKYQKDSYLDLEHLCDNAIFFDEIGKLNAGLELDKSLKKRWEVAINKLSATGASAGIHIIAISQYATQTGFLPALARVNCSDGVIMLGGAADSATERQYMMPGFEIPKRSYAKAQGLARFVSDDKYKEPRFYEAPWFR